MQGKYLFPDKHGKTRQCTALDKFRVLWYVSHIAASPCRSFWLNKCSRGRGDIEDRRTIISMLACDPAQAYHSGIGVAISAAFVPFCPEICCRTEMWFVSSFLIANAEH